ncbi:DUF5777 family beta-barrel protein [Pedobacter sandarakinus]|uniref:DUF5777 family beta-barrel protein n=1 Tax=Pedobacter sandarakinus TaxID=353156 RepID=UPI0022466C97|nr:DUF5777 family beta-barrel protein [Pedobacter sandarakinus]MCX2573306.1 DUF5777 family beta-barrel protein [Pedobacter sandarakinus]
MIKHATIWCLAIFSTVSAFGQDADSLLKSIADTTQKVMQNPAFKSTRIVLSHSTETQKKHDLDMRIRHHFGDIGGEFGSAHTLYGLDVASDLFIGFDYGITDNLTVSIGRSKHDELYNGFLKYKILTQGGGKNGNVPINVTFLAQMGWIARAPFNNTEFSAYANRFSYFLQPIFSRKITQKLSLQVAPAVLIRKNTTEPNDPQSLFSIGFAGRFKLTKRLSFVADYTLVNGLNRPKDLVQQFYNPLGVGLEIETGGHVFSLNFMNAEYISENSFIPDTKKSWGNGGVRFGFTISRNFTLFKSKDKDLQTKIY